MKSLTLITALFALAVPVKAGIYQWDDGSAESGIALAVLPPGQPPPITTGWLNAFQVTAGMETITAIEIAYGFPGNTRLSDGLPISLYLWTDPTNDGNPIDAMVQRSLGEWTASVNTNTFNVYTINPLTLPVGAWFFVGATSTYTEQIVPSALDYGPPSAHRSYLFDWTALEPVDPNNLGAARLAPTLLESMGSGGNWLIRAEATPEPGAIVLLAAPLAAITGAVVRRKRDRPDHTT